MACLSKLNIVINYSRRDDNVAKLFKSCTKWFEKHPVGCTSIKSRFSVRKTAFFVSMRSTVNQRVAGSNPASGAKSPARLRGFFSFFVIL